MTLRILFAIALGLTHFLGYPSLAQIQPPFHLSQNRPTPPPTPPNNQTKPGGGLNPSQPCSDTQTQLRALVPVENPVLTASEHPTFLFYVPHTPESVSYGEFSLLVWPGEKERIYKTRFTLPQTPGIVSVKLPESPEYALETGQSYHWYFKLYCEGNTSAQPDLQVNGWVKRVPLTPERERQIEAATPEVWYDALAKVAENLRTSPENAALQNDWENLLELINAEDLAEEPIVGAVIPLEPTFRTTKCSTLCVERGLSRNTQ
jgi:hypothetical protein